MLAFVLPHDSKLKIIWYIDAEHPKFYTIIYTNFFSIFMVISNAYDRVVYMRSFREETNTVSNSSEAMELQ